MLFRSHWNWQLTDGKLETEPRQGLRRFDVSLDGDDVILRV